MARDLSKGDIPALVLAVLADGPSHGYAIAREVERQSNQLFHLREGALYPALRVLEQDGLVISDWQTQASGPARKVYALTEAGQAELARRKDEWKAYSETINSILGRRANEQTA